MRNNVFLVIVLFLTLGSCAESETLPCDECKTCGLNLNFQEMSLEEAILKSKHRSGSFSESNEFKESVDKIEKKYGEQWDFCKCVVVNDSINRAITLGNTSDALMERWDHVDKKCQAFRIQDPNRTPEEREAHEQNVSDCLKKAGISVKF